VRLPHSQWCYRPFLSPPVAAMPSSAKNGFVTFGAFHQSNKMSPVTRRLWAQVLAAVPESRLIIVGVPRGRTEEDLRRDLVGPGTACERITTVPHRSLEDYLRGFEAVDIALDTMPYSGGTTTCDALWMGVPVITAPGSRSVSRSAASVGLVARDLRFVDLVHLLLVEEHLGVASVHLAAHEDVEEVGIDMVIFLHAPEDLERLRQRLALLVGAVFGGERLEDVSDPHA